MRRAAREYGGSCTGKGASILVQGRNWCLTSRLIHASNGEAALLFAAWILDAPCYIGGEPKPSASDWHSGYREALQAIGVEPV
jgi:hypothetical protein